MSAVLIFIVVFGIGGVIRVGYERWSMKRGDHRWKK